MCAEIKVSVIVPVYNVETYLHECLDSIIAQSHNNMEIICINDSSTDNSLKILQEYAEKDKRLIILNQPHNMGPSAARNRGLEVAAGKYILFVDSDDYIEKNLIEKTLKCAEKQQADEVFFNCEWVSASNNPGWQPQNALTSEVLESDIKTGKDVFIEREKAQSVVGRGTTAWSCLYRSVYLNENNLRFYEGILHEDMLFYFKRCMCSKRVVVYNEKLYFYRKRDNTITTSFREERAKSLFIIISIIYAYWINNDSDEALNKAIGNYLKTLWFHYIRAIYTGEVSGNNIKSTPSVDYMYTLVNNINDAGKEILEKKDIEYLIKQKRFMIYGCGKVASEVMQCLNKYHLSPSNILVESREGNPEFFGGIKVNTLQEMGYIGDLPVVIAVSKRFGGGIQEKLSNLGYTGFICIRE
ncbi:glycosyltransferase [Anaerovibrio sp. RM50]|uniref:glycosyltransferase n=1 Tax=Anaerovibrio sp. RM50 TaxID=1200557 RepID=UPI00068574E6|nr:glycosyltransferase [Anaerovibrio sp. RM50]